MLDRREIRETAEAIAGTCSVDGWIPWEPGRHVDPWNMVEATIGLDVAGMHHEARAAYEWLRSVQDPDGSWAAAYMDGTPFDRTIDANFTAYPAAGVWFHFMLTGDDKWLSQMWPTVERGLDHVLDMQLPTGAIGWARDPDGNLWEEGLLTSSSSIFHSLWCGVTIAEVLGHERPDWELSLASLQAAIRDGQGPFMDKSRFAMDHYYPALTGVVTDSEAIDRLDGCVERFVIDGIGCLCTDDRPWVTSGETSELVIALVAHGRDELAADLLQGIQRLRTPDGLYWTGSNHPGGEVWPNERTTWSAGAVLMASDAVAGGPVAGLFTGSTLAPRAEFAINAGERA